MDPAGVFCTRLGPPKSHIMKKSKHVQRMVYLCSHTFPIAPLKEPLTYISICWVSYILYARTCLVCNLLIAAGTRACDWQARASRGPIAAYMHACVEFIYRDL